MINVITVSELQVYTLCIIKMHITMLLLCNQ